MSAPHIGFYNTASTRTHVRYQFSTHAAAGANVAPSSAFEAADLRIYKATDGAAFSATQRTSANGITMTSPFDSLTGFHDIDIDLTDNTDSGFYAAGCTYMVVLAPDETVDSQTITAIPLFMFDIGVLPVNVTQFGGTAGTFSSGRPEVNTTHAAGTAWGSGAITAASIASDAITAAKIATGAIDADAIADNAIDAGAIASGAITSAKFAAGAIDATAIADNAIDAGAIATGAITSAKFAAGAITATVIATDAIDDDALAADAVSAIQSGLATAAALDTVDNFLDTEIAAILEDTGTTLDTKINAILALLDDARGEPGQGNPPVNPDAMTKIDYLYKAWRNKKDNNGTETKLYADDGSTVDHKQSTSEDAGTVTTGEWATGA